MHIARLTRPGATVPRATPGDRTPHGLDQVLALVVIAVGAAVLFRVAVGAHVSPPVAAAALVAIVLAAGLRVLTGLPAGARASADSRAAGASTSPSGPALGPAPSDTAPGVVADALVATLARRNQLLVTRQLAKLDAMEAAEQDSTTLSDLFVLDHLATRMRRNAESLLVLSGEQTPRIWRRAVTLADVLRGAVAEIESFHRVDFSLHGTGALTGASVVDVVHLLAELLENATANSPEPSRVHVGGAPIEGGYELTVTDEGPGFASAERARVTALLAATDPFGQPVTEGLGFAVVSRLAARWGIRVSLRATGFGEGTCVVVLVPAALLLGASVTPPEHRVHQQPLDPVVFDPAPDFDPEAYEPVPVGTDGVQPVALVRRVPQASIAAQMAAGPTAPALPSQAVAVPAPEHTRSLLSTYRDGLTQGRTAADPEPVSGDAPAAVSSAQEVS